MPLRLTALFCTHIAANAQKYPGRSEGRENRRAESSLCQLQNEGKANLVRGRNCFEQTATLQNPCHPDVERSEDGGTLRRRAFLCNRREYHEQWHRRRS